MEIVRWNIGNSAATAVPYQKGDVMVYGHVHTQPMGSTGSRRQKSKKQSTRRVRFALEATADDCMVVIDPEPTPPPLMNEQDHANCWWSRQEIRDACFDAQEIVDDIIDHDEVDSIDELNRFFKYWTLSASHRSMMTRMNDASTKRLVRSLLQHHHEVDCRGLENFAYPIIHRHRVWHEQSLLTAQARIPPGAGPEVRERLLSAISVQTSKASKMLARLLAHCDACQVVNQAELELRDYA